MIVPGQGAPDPPTGDQKKGASYIFRARRTSVRPFSLHAVILLVFLAGCWPFNRGPTPQQKFFDQLNRGDEIGANQIWLEMSPGDREKLWRGQGVRQRPAREQIKAALERHHPGDTTTVTVGSRQDPSFAGWQTLPQLQHATPIPSRSSDA